MKTESRLVVDALRIGSKESSNCIFILIMTPRMSIRWFSKIKKVRKRWSKTGSLNVKILFLKGLKNGTVLRRRNVPFWQKGTFGPMCSCYSDQLLKTQMRMFGCCQGCPVGYLGSKECVGTVFIRPPHSWYHSLRARFWRRGGY